MKRKIWPFLLAAVLLVAGIAGSILVMRKPQSSLVNIVRDGKILYQLDLEKEEDRVIEVEYEGRHNKIEIRDHKIRVLEADCPDQICVGMGWLGSAAPIVCLPNRLVIEPAETMPDMDAVAG